MTAVAPIFVAGTDGNELANGTVLAANAALVLLGTVIDLTADFEGEVTGKIVFTTVSGTAGIVIGFYNVTAAGTASTPSAEISIIAVGTSTQISSTGSLSPGKKYQPYWSNKDASNGVTVGLTVDLITGIG